MDFKGKCVLITGGSSGIGKAAAKQLHKLGAKIIIQARNLEKLKKAASEIDSEFVNVHYYSTDLTDETEVLKAATKIIATHGIPDAIVNSAGEGEWLGISEAFVSHYEQTIASPYLVTALTCKVFYDKMKAEGKLSGHFVIVNSAASYFSFPGATGYLPARWAMLGYARALQADLHKTNIKVSLIALGKVASPYFSSNPISEERIPKVSDWLIPTLSEEKAGNALVSIIKNPKRETIKPNLLAIFVFMNRFYPGLFKWLMRLK